MTVKIRFYIIALSTLVIFLLTTFAFVGVARADSHNDINGSTVDTRAELRDKAEEKRIQLREEADALRSNAQDRKAQLDARREEALEKARILKEEAVERSDIRKQKLDERRKERIGAYVARIVKRMNAAVERLGRIADRVDSRIAKLEERIDGLSLDESKSLLSIVREELRSAAVDIGAIAEALQGALDSDTPKEAFEEVRALFGEAKQSIKDAHKTLVEAIKSVKAAASLRSDTVTEDEDNGSNGESVGGDSE